METEYFVEITHYGLCVDTCYSGTDYAEALRVFDQNRGNLERGATCSLIAAV